MNPTSHLFGKLSLLVQACVLLSLLTMAVQADPITYSVTLNTSAISGQNGFINFQFNPGGASAAPGTASITGFSFNGGSGPGASADRAGGAVGQLPSTVTIANSGQLNELFQSFGFGSSLSFTVTLNVSNTSIVGSIFGLSLYAANGTTPLLTTSSLDTVLTIALGTNSPVVIATPASGPGGAASIVTVRQIGAEIPEPATLALLGTGLAGIAAAVKRRKAGIEDQRKASSIK